MSWLTKIKDGLTIETGDGITYYPYWVNAVTANRSKEFNTSEFEFVDLGGTLVDRRKPKGNRYTLEVGFQGADHLDQADRFYKSADNEKYWILQHPLYGIINVQPLSLAQDNTGFNTSKFTIPIVETIIDENPKTAPSTIDSITIQKVVLDEASAEINASLNLQDVNNIRDANQKNFNLSVPIIKLPEEFQNYFNLFNQANAALDTATASPLLAMRAAISLINAPGQFSANVKTRINTLNAQFNSLRANLSNLDYLTGKQTFQALAGSLISSMCLSVTLPQPGDLSNSTKVTDVLNTINNAYNSYLSDLDFLQSPNGNSPLSFIPNFNAISALNELINTTTSYLFVTIIGARRERSIICDKDTNIILLTKRFYGLDKFDKNIDELIENNNLSLDELIIIPKGRKITYYA